MGALFSKRRRGLRSNGKNDGTSTAMKPMAGKADTGYVDAQPLPMPPVEELNAMFDLLLVTSGI
jgi:hypothetical protein